MIRYRFGSFKDEEVAHKENMYEERINSLMGEVGVLRNEVYLPFNIY